MRSAADCLSDHSLKPAVLHDSECCPPPPPPPGESCPCGQMVQAEINSNRIQTLAAGA